MEYALNPFTYALKAQANKIISFIYKILNFVVGRVRIKF